MNVEPPCGGTGADGKKDGAGVDGENVDTGVDGEKDSAGVDGENVDAGVDGEKDSAGVGGENVDAGVDGEKNGAGVDGENVDTGVDGKNDSAGVDGRDPEGSLIENKAADDGDGEVQETIGCRTGSSTDPAPAVDVREFQIIFKYNGKFRTVDLGRWI